MTISWISYFCWFVCKILTNLCLFRVHTIGSAVFSVWIQTTRHTTEILSFTLYQAFRALRAYLLFQLWTCSHCNIEKKNKKFGPDHFSRFDIYWIQTDRQTSFLYLVLYCSTVIIFYKKSGFSRLKFFLPKRKKFKHNFY